MTGYSNIRIVILINIINSILTNESLAAGQAGNTAAAARTLDIIVNMHNVLLLHILLVIML